MVGCDDNYFLVHTCARIIMCVLMHAGFRLTNYTNSQHCTRLVSAFRAFASAWVKSQRPSGMWSQLLNDDDTYECSSATGFGLYALATGRRMGFLNGAEIDNAIKHGWQALAGYIQVDGSVAGLSNGFGILGSKAAYMRRTNSSLLWGYGAVLRACAAVSSL